ncbi:hypothetical protein TM7_0590 [candidate division TM7 genomosp. GTL1]|nr:hypothetical protein TM7_0590 [candidate division TM7 genomosp. GTL1]
MKYRLITALVLCALLAAASVQTVSAASALVVSEVQTTGCKEYQVNDPNKCAVDDSRQEFIELYNTSASDIAVDGWSVEYLSASYSGSGTPTRVIAQLSGKVRANARVLLSFEGYIQNADLSFGAASSSGYLAKSGGHIRLVDKQGGVLDLISWGSASQLASWPKVPEIPSGISAERLFPGDPQYNEAAPFVNTNGITPQSGGLEPWECEGVVLSEIVPNPISTDTGHEFIELHNPGSEAVHLRGCSVRIDDGAPFSFSDQIIAPGQYLALSDAQTHLTLPNSAGATAWLITSLDETGVQYPANMAEGDAWAFANGQWRPTTTATPNTANVITEPTADGGKGGGASDRLSPCPFGKYRSPETNRCRTIQASAGLKPCRSDQERNPETNRCRSATVTSAALTPCKPGQVRNSETNRCRSTATLSSALKPCKSGQERNADTSRCRKKVGAESAGYKAEKTPAPPQLPAGWIAAGAAGVGVTGYGIYEWRREIGEFLGRIKNKFSTSTSP